MTSQEAMGFLVRRYRTRAALDQTTVAEKIQVSQPTYSRIERGLTDITVQNLIDLSNLYKVKIALLLQQLMEVAIASAQLKSPEEQVDAICKTRRPA